MGKDRRFSVSGISSDDCERTEEVAAIMREDLIDVELRETAP